MVCGLGVDLTMDSKRTYISKNLICAQILLTILGLIVNIIEGDLRVDLRKGIFTLTI